MFTPDRSDSPPDARWVDLFFTTLDLEVLLGEKDDPARRASLSQSETISRQVEPAEPVSPK